MSRFISPWITTYSYIYRDTPLGRRYLCSGLAYLILVPVLGLSLTESKDPALLTWWHENSVSYVLTLCSHLFDACHIHININLLGAD